MANCGNNCGGCGIVPIFSVSTARVTTDTPNTSVIYDLDQCQFNSLPSRGLMLLHVRQAPATGSDAFLVSVSVCRTVASGTGVITTSNSPLVNARLEQVASSEIVLGSRYLIYFDKCQGLFEIVNAITVPAAAAAGDGA